jgi:hypothetical protein
VRISVTKANQPHDGSDAARPHGAPVPTVFRTESLPIPIEPPRIIQAKQKDGAKDVESLAKYRGMALTSIKARCQSTAHLAGVSSVMRLRLFGFAQPAAERAVS